MKKHIKISLQKLSSLNIFLAILYVLVYLKSGTFNSTAGIFMIIVFNWLGLRSFQLENHRWGIWHYLVGGWVLYFIGTLLYGAVNILCESIEFGFFSNDTVWYLVINFIFCGSILTQITSYGYKNYLEIKLK